MRRLVERFEALMAAVAFAEEGEVDTARLLARRAPEASRSPER
jgi:hypothetical protein